VAAMHVLVQDGRALQSGRKAFSEAKDSLDGLITEQRQIAATLTTQCDRLGAVLAMLEDQDVDALRAAMQQHFAGHARLLSAAEAAVRTAESSITAKQNRVEEKLSDMGERLKDVAALTRQNGEIATQRQVALEQAIQQLSKELTTREASSAARTAELEKRLATLTVLTVVVLLAVAIAIVLPLVR